MRLRQKLDVFRVFGVATTFVARFDARLAALTPEQFIDDVLVARLDARWVLVGDDFRFGKGRAGDLSVLRAHARTFSVEAMHTVAIDDGARIVHRGVRSALAAGDLARATALLGRPYSLTGRVAHGDKRGRELGFPTANIALRQRPALSGIFAVRVHGLDGGPRAAVASLGIRPTVKTDGAPVLEVYIFDFAESIYGRRIKVEFLHKLRDEAKYDDLDALTQQIRADVAHARDYFATARP